MATGLNISTVKPVYSHYLWDQLKWLLYKGELFTQLKCMRNNKIGTL